MKTLWLHQSVTPIPILICEDAVRILFVSVSIPGDRQALQNSVQRLEQEDQNWESQDRTR